MLFAMMHLLVARITVEVGETINAYQQNPLENPFAYLEMHLVLGTIVVVI